jgi:hypothetical protein
MTTLEVPATGSSEPELPRAPTELPPEEQGATRRFARRSGYPLFVAAEFILFFLLWEYMTAVTETINPVFLPPPSQTVIALADRSPRVRWSRSSGSARGRGPSATVSRRS